METARLLFQEQLRIEHSAMRLEDEDPCNPTRDGVDLPFCIVPSNVHSGRYCDIAGTEA